jgi:hypothetical protein
MVTAAAAAAVTTLSNRSISWSSDSIADFTKKLDQLASDPSAIDAMRGYRELQDVLALAPQAALPKAPKSNTPISDAANDLIIRCEVSGRDRYTQKYQKPIWPKGNSGVTIGIGYDLGYVDEEQLTADWGGRISDADIAVLKPACGVRGISAKHLLAPLSSVSINWQTAKLQFAQEIRPRYVGLTEKTLSNCADLSPHCLGALVSLVYNRGPSWEVSSKKDLKGRYEEMRNIKSHMSNRAYKMIPNEIRSMKRLWDGVPDMGGLLVRRDLEAELFQLGLS